MKSSAFYLTVVVSLFSLSSALAIETSELTGLGENKKVHAKLIMPDGKGPFPAVLVLHGDSGVKKPDLDFAQGLAHEGYACLVPYYFDTYHIAYDTRNWAMTTYAPDILKDFTSEIDYLKTLPKINKNKVGAVGFSMGGYWALLLSGMEKTQAGISYYGALDSGAIDSVIRYHFDDIFNKHSSPVLVLNGEDDMTVDVKYAKQFAAMLKGKFSKYEIHIYPNAGHHFDRGEALHMPAVKDSWSKTLAFLKKYLQPARNPARQ